MSTRQEAAWFLFLLPLMIIMTIVQFFTGKRSRYWPFDPQ